MLSSLYEEPTRKIGVVHRICTCAECSKTKVVIILFHRILAARSGTINVLFFRISLKIWKEKLLIL